MLGGLRGVLITDFFQFFIAMFGAVAVAYVALGHPKVGGLSNLLSNPNITGRLSLLPDFSNTDLLMAVFIIPIAVQWWASWYPGAEPGGGGYIAQRMFAAKDEKNAVGATLLFNVAHYALRPWPWIIVALASLLVFPDMASLKAAFPDVTAGKMGHDLAYPAMISFLPHGLLGLVVASLVAAFMSTISTHLNWGSSYIVNDFYKRFVKPEATEKEQVMIGRLSTLGLMILAGFMALAMQSAFQAFKVLLQIGAGTGLLFLLRWFWWRISAISEITAMVVSFVVAIYFEFIHTALGFAKLEDWQKFVCSVAITTIAWVTVTFMTRPTADDTLIKFCRLIRPGGPGWKKFLLKIEAQGNDVTELQPTGQWEVTSGLLSIFLGCLTVYGALFSIGFWLYGNVGAAIVTTLVAAIAGYGLSKTWRRTIGGAPNTGG
jgi:Na+/proline symporter